MYPQILWEPVADELETSEHIFGTNDLEDYVMSTAKKLQWIRCCATNRKVAGSIPAGVIGIFH